MKKLVIFLILISQSALCQTYEFSKLTTYAIDFESYKGEKTVFSNPKDQSQFLWLKKEGGKTTGMLTDLKSMRVHYFLVESSGKKGNVSLDFKYFGSDDINESAMSKANCSIENVSETDSSKTLRLTFYKNQKKTKVRNKAIVLVKKQPESQFPLFRVSCMHGSEFDAGWNYDIGGIVQSVIFEGEHLGTYKLELEQSVALKLSLPQKLTTVQKNQFGIVSVP